VTVDKVVDASALAALLFNEPAGESIAERIEGASLYAPPILEIELANICWKKNRRDPGHAEARRAALLRYPMFAIKIVQTEMVPTVDLASDTGLTAYDAAYLLVAHIVGAELVTLDDRLAKTAAKYLARP
jgi:predicted nucleic acid-binding protein